MLVLLALVALVSLVLAHGLAVGRYQSDGAVRLVIALALLTGVLIALMALGAGDRLSLGGLRESGTGLRGVTYERVTYLPPPTMAVALSNARQTTHRTESAMTSNPESVHPMTPAPSKMESMSQRMTALRPTRTTIPPRAPAKLAPPRGFPAES